MMRTLRKTRPVMLLLSTANAAEHGDFPKLILKYISPAVKLTSLLSFKTQPKQV